MVTLMIPSSVARCCVGAFQPWASMYSGMPSTLVGCSSGKPKAFFVSTCCGAGGWKRAAPASCEAATHRPDRDNEDVQHGQEDGLLARQLEEEAPRHTDERRQHPESHARNEEGVLDLE